MSDPIEIISIRRDPIPPQSHGHLIIVTLCPYNSSEDKMMMMMIIFTNGLVIYLAFFLSYIFYGSALCSSFLLTIMSGVTDFYFKNQLFSFSFICIMVFFWSIFFFLLPYHSYTSFFVVRTDTAFVY